MAAYCPYWIQKGNEPSAASRSCALADHGGIQCANGEFQECARYRERCAVLRREAEARGLLFSDTRRRYPRFAHRIPLAYAVRLRDADEHSSPFQGEGHTLDLSLGGMRIHIDSRLPAEAVVSFIFGGGFGPPTQQKRLGQVRWCAEQVQSDGYHAGVAFLESVTSDAVGIFLGLDF